jgi:hypothetical protein
MKLIWTIWQDFGYLIYKRKWWVKTSIEKWIFFNKKLLELILTN